MFGACLMLHLFISWKHHIMRMSSVLNVKLMRMFLNWWGYNREQCVASYLYSIGSVEVRTVCKEDQCSCNKETKSALSESARSGFAYNMFGCDKLC